VSSPENARRNQRGTGPVKCPIAAKRVG
jgi:hypothetical protein